MLVVELFDHADHTPKKSAQTGKQTQEQGQNYDFNLVEEAINELDLAKAGSQEMSDILTARELIGQALQNPGLKDKYFEYLKYLRDKHGAEYSTDVHQKAAKLSKLKEEKR